MKAKAERSDGEKLRRASAESVARGTGAGVSMEQRASRPEAVAQRRLEALANQSGVQIPLCYAVPGACMIDNT